MTRARLGEVFRLRPRNCGTAFAFFLTILCASAEPQYTILKSFGFPDQTGINPDRDGTSPNHLFEASDGVLYGTTESGGSSDGGTVFRINKDGSNYSLLWEFPSPPSVPYGLVEANDGLLYGVARGGGSFSRGAVFRLNTTGTDFAIVFSFNGTNGSAPQKIIQASNGALYGTTLFGGTFNRGTIYRINKDGSEHTILHNFNFDGSYPPGGLLEGSDGWLYGVSENGGSFQAGLIFRLRKDGTSYMEVYGFPHQNGSDPTTLPVEASDGTRYGATSAGGSADAGIIFKLNKDGTGFVKLFDFPSRGLFTSQQVIVASDGVLYGTTYTSGISNQGTLFRLSPDGARYAVLHHFTNSAGDGGRPWSPLFEGTDGSLYGTTSWGGTLNLGTIFRYVPAPEIVSVEPQTTGTVQVTARALSGNTVAVEASTNLTTWTQFASGPATNAHLTAQDAEAFQHRHRFYRARLER